MPGPVQLTPAVLASLRIPPQAAPAAEALLKALVGQALEATLVSTGPDGLRLRLADGKELTAQGSLPFPAGSALALKALPLPGGAGLRLQVVRATPPPAPPLLHPLTRGEAAPLLARLQNPTAALAPLVALLQRLGQAGSPAPDRAEAWGLWLKEAVKALADPAASPEEAPFHQLQAREGTGLFELPLPWGAGAEPLRLWIEADQEGDGVVVESVHRVFLSVPFSSLGEVRVGLESRAAGLKARVWLRDPGQVSGLQETLQEALRSLGHPATLQILQLPEGGPSLSALARGPSLQAMG